MSTNWTDELSQLMEHHEVEAPAGLWEGIEQGLGAQRRVRRAKLVWPWRIGVAAAVVAGVVAGVQLWDGGRDGVVGHDGSIARGGDGEMDYAAVAPGAVTYGPEVAMAEPVRMEPVVPTEGDMLSAESSQPALENGQPKSENSSATTENDMHASASSQPASVATTDGQRWSQTGRWKGRGVPARHGRGSGNRYAVNLQLMANARYAGGASLGDVGLGPCLDSDYRLQGDSVVLQSQRREKMPMPARAQRAVDTSPRYTNHDFPVKVGATVRVPLNRWLAIDAGVSYAQLRSELDFTAPNGERKTGGVQRVHYLGVPVSLVGTLWDNRRWNVYASAGGEVAKSVRTVVRDREGTVYDGYERPWQGAVTVAAGVQLNLNRWVGLYVQPSVDYYFDNHSTVQTYYSEHPLAPALRLGLRVRVKE